MSRAEELEALIDEQRSEMRLGNYQPQERFVAFSMDGLSRPSAVESSTESWDTFITTFDDTTGSLRIPSARRSKDMCVIHGNGGVKMKPSGGWFCRHCERERNRLRRRANGVKPRGACEHGDAHRVTLPSGKTRCRECRRRAERDYYARNRDAIRAADRERYARKRSPATGPKV